MKKRSRKVLGGCVSALLLTGSWFEVAEAVECVSLDLSLSCHRTIQAGVDAAAPGEEVAVYPGTYAENISVDTTGVQVVGKGWLRGQVVIKPEGGGVTVSLNAPRVTLKKVTVRGGETGIVVAGVGTTIFDVSVQHSGIGISILTDTAQVIQSTVQNTDTGIIATGSGLLVQSSVIQLARGACIDVNGDGVHVEKSRMVDCGKEGVKISGGAALILQNELSVAGHHMIHVVGPGARIQGNKLEAGRYAAIHVSSDAPVVVSNTAHDCDSGIDVRCDSCAGGLVEGNVATGTYYCPGFDVHAGSAGLLVRGNTSSHSSDEGFSLSGVGMLVQSNRAFNNGTDGFSVQSGSDIQLIGNKAYRNFRNGIRIDSGATGTLVQRNHARDNDDVDFFDAGSGTILGTGANRNFFGTVGGP